MVDVFQVLAREQFSEVHCIGGLFAIGASFDPLFKSTAEPQFAITEDVQPFFSCCYLGFLWAVPVVLSIDS